MLSEILRSTDVFTPNEFPAWTYVERQDDFERQVMNGLRTPNIIVSVSGPSKSGKSVLLQKVVGKDNLIRIFGPQIKEPGDVWDAVLDWIGTPVSRTVQATDTTTSTRVIGGQSAFGVPGMVSAGGKVDYGDSSASASMAGTSHARAGLKQVEREIGGSDYVVFLDDFHYMARPLQVEVAKQLKAAAELGIKICTASVPHRSDDVVRANTELRGRVQAVDMQYWPEKELVQIGIGGFPRLDMDVTLEFIERLALEACGSPQIMQSLCLQTCYRHDIFESGSRSKRINIDGPDLSRILETTSTLSDFSTLVEAMHVGPKLRGQDRNKFSFMDETVGDVYRAVLKAVASDPPVMTFSYGQLLERVNGICSDKSQAPVGSSISEACRQIAKIARKSVEVETGVQGLPPVEWDTSADVENLHVAEPYFLFYLRASSKLKKLGSS